MPEELRGGCGCEPARPLGGFLDGCNNSVILFFIIIFLLLFTDFGCGCGFRR